MASFVIRYNRRTGESSVDEFSGPLGHRHALARRLELERDSNDPDIEVVSLMSDSIETVARTHSRYFRGGFNIQQPA